MKNDAELLDYFFSEHLKKLQRVINNANQRYSFYLFWSLYLKIEIISVGI